MDLLERNRRRLAMLDKVPGEARRACALGRLISVEETEDGDMGIALDFWESDGWNGLSPCVPTVKREHSDPLIREALNGGALRILELPGLADAPVTGIVMRNLEMKAGDVKALVKQPQLARAAGLDFTGVAIGAGLAALVKSPHVSRLRRLELLATKAKTSPLSGPTSLGNLEHLGLGACRLKSQQLGEIVHSPGLPALRSLSFRANDVDDEGIQQLVRSEALARITHLDLALSRLVTPEGWKALAESAHLEHLRLLDVSDNELKAAAAPLLAGPLTRCEDLRIDLAEGVPELKLPSLRRLDVGVHTNSALARLADQLPSFARLEALTLRLFFYLEDLTPVRALLESGGLAALRTLEIQVLQPTAERLDPLFELPMLPALRRLRIAEGPIAPRHIERLSQWPGLAGLEELVLTADLANPEAVKLASAPMERLKRLELKLATGTPALVAALASNPALTNLQSLLLPHRSATGTAFEALAASHTLTSLVELDLSPHHQVTVEQARALFRSPNLPNLWIARGVEATGTGQEARQFGEGVCADPERRTVRRL
ncbi:MAG: hypothetical protein HY898_05820 [Deltaproteobacteria bacterium]|nr:hypothetical protein [Deltaproteobacteria bacterium]